MLSAAGPAKKAANMSGVRPLLLIHIPSISASVAARLPRDRSSEATVSMSASCTARNSAAVAAFNSPGGTCTRDGGNTSGFGTNGSISDSVSVDDHFHADCAGGDETGFGGAGIGTSFQADERGGGVGEVYPTATGFGAVGACPRNERPDESSLPAVSSTLISQDHKVWLMPVRLPE